MSRLLITYSVEEPYEGWVDVRLLGDFAGTGGFSGEPGAFARFVEVLSAYPLSVDHSPWFVEEDVLIEIIPVDSVGHFRLTVELGDRGDDGTMVRATFQIEYAWIARLREALCSFIRTPDSGVEIEIR